MAAADAAAISFSTARAAAAQLRARGRDCRRLRGNPMNTSPETRLFERLSITALPDNS
jgi:hypothetical protein